MVDPDAFTAFEWIAQNTLKNATWGDSGWGTLPIFVEHKARVRRLGAPSDDGAIPGGATNILEIRLIMYYCYLVRCADGTLYCGSTKDTRQRMQQHNAGKGSVYVRTHGGGKLVYTERFATIGDALRREIEVKKWPRKKKENLIKDGRP